MKIFYFGIDKKDYYLSSFLEFNLGSELWYTTTKTDMRQWHIISFDVKTNPKIDNTFILQLCILWFNCKFGFGFINRNKRK